MLMFTDSHLLVISKYLSSIERHFPIAALNIITYNTLPACLISRPGHVGQGNVFGCFNPMKKKSIFHALHPEKPHCL